MYGVFRCFKRICYALLGEIFHFWEIVSDERIPGINSEAVDVGRQIITFLSNEAGEQ